MQTVRQGPLAAGATADRAEPTAQLNDDDGARPAGPRVELRFVDPGTDWPALVEARLRAFDGSALNERMYPVASRPAWADRVAAEVRQAQRAASRPVGVFHVCATVDGRPVGFATYHLKPDRRSTNGLPTAEDEVAERALRALGEGGLNDSDRAYEQTVDRAFVGRFKDALDRGRRDWAKGRPYWLLAMLCVHPDAQGLGVGRRLLEWGVAQADQRGLPTYLETSAAAQALYASAGFDVVSSVSWASAGEADDAPGLSMPTMVRPARPWLQGWQKPDPVIPRPQVVLSDLGPDDWADMARIKILALGAEGVLFNGVWPRERQPDLATRVAWLARIQSLSAQFPTQERALIKASIDGRTVGFALWETPVDRTPTLGLPSATEKDRARAAEEATERVKGEEDEARERAFDGNFAAKWKRDSGALRVEAFRGQAHWYLDTLGVHPDYQGFGIGRKLCEWGMVRADAAGVPCYLEASRLGRPLYERLGFVSVGEIPAKTADGTTFSLPGMVRLPPPSSSPKVVLSFVVPELDGAPLARVRQVAFEDSDMVEHIYKTECVPSLQDRIDGTIRSETRKEPFVTSETVRVKATLAGVPVGFAVWLAPVDRTSTDGDPLPDEAALEERQDAAVAAAKNDTDRAYEATINKAFHGTVGKVFEEGRKRRYAGRRHWYLTMVAVHPAYQGRGIGKALLDWGNAQADADGLPVYLEASHEGVGLYASRGFETVAQLDLSEGVVHPAMERLPRPLPNGFEMPTPVLRERP